LNLKFKVVKLKAKAVKLKFIGFCLGLTYF